MFLLDIFHYLINKNKKRGIFKFLSIPTISSDIDDEEEEYYYMRHGEHCTKDDLKLITDEISETLNQREKKVKILNNKKNKDNNDDIVDDGGDDINEKINKNLAEFVFEKLKKIFDF